MIDIDDTKNAEGIQELLRQGEKTEFWEIICSAVDKIIADIQEQIDGKEIVKLPANQYKVTMEILKGRKRDLLKLKEMPNNLIIDLDTPDQTEEDTRVYEDIRDLDIQN